MEQKALSFWKQKTADPVEYMAVFWGKVRNKQVVRAVQPSKTARTVKWNHD